MHHDDHGHDSAGEGRGGSQLQRADRSEPGAQRGNQLHITGAHATEGEERQEERDAGEPPEGRLTAAIHASVDDVIDQRDKGRAKSQQVGNTPRR
jgi:hypothetical protein